MPTSTKTKLYPATVTTRLTVRQAKWLEKMAAQQEKSPAAYLRDLVRDVMVAK